jgi:hypothetical protein
MARTLLTWSDNRSKISLPDPRLDGHEWKVDFHANLYRGPNTREIQQYMLKDDKVVETKKIVVHKFTMGDVEDPDLYAAEPLWNWQQSEAGKWVMENALDTPEWHRHADAVSWGHSYTVVAVFEAKKLTEFYLRFGKTTA